MQKYTFSGRSASAATARIAALSIGRRLKFGKVLSQYGRDLRCGKYPSTDVVKNRFVDAACGTVRGKIERAGSCSQVVIL